MIVRFKPIVISILASIFLAISFREFSILSDFKIAAEFSASNAMAKLDNGEFTVGEVARFHHLAWIKNIAMYCGSIFSLIISILLLYRKKYHWSNSLIVLAIIILLNIFGFINSKILITILIFPGKILTFLPTWGTYFFNGFLLLLIGLSLLRLVYKEW